MQNTSVLYRKMVDKSVLHDGLSIPLEYHKLFHLFSPAIIEHGTDTPIKILFDGVLYDAKLKNQAFDQSVWEGHCDVLQIRYAPKSPISQKMRDVFWRTNQYIQEQKALRKPGDRTHIRIPDDLKEYLYISATAMENVYAIDYVTANEDVILHNDIKGVSEEMFESNDFIPLTDSTTGYTEAIRKVRKLDKSIGDTLKKLYDYRCQITGEKIGDEYNAHVVEAHHIMPFTESLNNDTSNLIIVNPTFHRIIHQTKPEYKNLSFIFPNGVVEKIILNKHL